MTSCCGRDKYCITVSGTTNEEMWYEIVSVLGPSNFTEPDQWQAIRAADIAEYEVWTTTNFVVPFDKWFIWKKRVGTAEYGNLPKNKKHEGKVGHKYAPCPYSTQASDLRTRHLLNLSDEDLLPIKNDHDIAGIKYYMTTKGKGSAWGFECPYPGCPHFILTGEQFFYI